MKRALASAAFLASLLVSMNCSKKTAAVEPAAQVAEAKPAVSQTVATPASTPPPVAPTDPSSPLHIGVEPKRNTDSYTPPPDPKAAEPVNMNPCAGHGRVAGSVKFDGAVQYVCSDNSMQPAPAVTAGCDQASLSSASAVWAAYAANHGDELARVRAEEYAARVRDCQRATWQKAMQNGSQNQSNQNPYPPSTPYRH